MAQKIRVELVDDLDGKNADETVTFALDGRGYEIDLSKRNAAALRKALTPYVSSGRRVGKTKVRSNGRAKTGTRPIREWARSNGFEVSDRGAIPTRVREAYEAAQK